MRMFISIAALAAALTTPALGQNMPEMWIACVAPMKLEPLKEGQQPWAARNPVDAEFVSFAYFSAPEKVELNIDQSVTQEQIDSYPALAAELGCTADNLDCQPFYGNTPADCFDLDLLVKKIQSKELASLQ